MKLVEVVGSGSTDVSEDGSEEGARSESTHVFSSSS